MLDYDTIVTALFMDGDEYNRCTGCGKMTQEDKLSSGRCNICSAPVKGMPMAASLDMDAIAEKVAGELVDAGVLDRFRKKPKTIEQLLEEQRAMFMDIGEKETDKAVADIQKGVAALPQELRKRFPKK